MKKLLCVLMTAAMILGCFACAPAATTAPAATEAPAAEATAAPAAEATAEAPAAPEYSGELRVTAQAWMMGKYDFEGMKADFEAKHPGVTVVYNQVDNADVTTNMLQWSQGKTDCDIAIGGSREHAVQYAAMDYIIEFDDSFFTGDFAKENFFNSFLELGNVEGHQYMIPFTGECMFIVVNKDLAKQAGIADADGNVPAVATWDELIEYAKKGAAIGKTGLSIDWGTNFMTYSYLSSLQGLRGTIFADDGKSIDFSSAEAQQVLTSWKKLVDEGCTPTDTFADMDAGRTNFKAGNVMMLMTAASRWIECQAQVGQGNTTVIPIPGTDTNGSLAYIHGAVIPKASKQIDLAKLFIQEEMLSDHVQQTALNTYGKMSPLLKHYEGLENPDWPTVVAATKKAATPPLYKDYAELDTGIICPVMQKYLIGDATLEDTVKTLTDSIASLDLSTGLK